MLILSAVIVSLVSILSFLDHCWHPAWPFSNPLVTWWRSFAHPCFDVTHMDVPGMRQTPSHLCLITNTLSSCRLKSFSEKCPRNSWVDGSWESRAPGPAPTLAENLNFFTYWNFLRSCLIRELHHKTTKSPSPLSPSPPHHDLNKITAISPRCLYHHHCWHWPLWFPQCVIREVSSELKTWETEGQSLYHVQQVCKFHTLPELWSPSACSWCCEHRNKMCADCFLWSLCVLMNSNCLLFLFSIMPSLI